MFDITSIAVFASGKPQFFYCTFSLERNSTKKFKHGGGYNTAVHTP